MPLTQGTISPHTKFNQNRMKKKTEKIRYWLALAGWVGQKTAIAISNDVLCPMLPPIKNRIHIR